MSFVCLFFSPSVCHSARSTFGSAPNLLNLEKYENQDLSTKKAIEKANQAFRYEDVRAFLLKYASLLTFIFKLRDGYLHDKVINSIEKYIEENIELKKAIGLS